MVVLEEDIFYSDAKIHYIALQVYMPKFLDNITYEDKEYEQAKDDYKAEIINLFNSSSDK